MRDEKGILFTGGSGPHKSFVEKLMVDAMYIAAADSGLDLALQYGIEPELIVGDMDSLENRNILDTIPEDRKIIFPVDKDETDTEIGISLLHQKGFHRVTVIGGGGGRIDHFLGILYLFFRDKYPIEWYTHDYQIVCIDKPVTIHGKIGGTVSFFPSSKGTCRAKSRGLKWNLDGLDWSVGDCGISNIIAESQCSVIPEEGRIMLVAHLQEELILE